LFASVAPEVNRISLGRALMTAAIRLCAVSTAAIAAWPGACRPCGLAKISV